MLYSLFNVSKHSKWFYLICLSWCKFRLTQCRKKRSRAEEQLGYLHALFLHYYTSLLTPHQFCRRGPLCGVKSQSAKNWPLNSLALHSSYSCFPKSVSFVRKSMKLSANYLWYDVVSPAWVNCHIESSELYLRLVKAHGLKTHCSVCPPLGQQPLLKAAGYPFGVCIRWMARSLLNGLPRWLNGKANPHCKCRSCRKMRVQSWLGGS